MKNKRRGFTLIELLVVVLIIGILAAVALPQYQKAVYKTRAMSLLPLLRSIEQAEQRYFLANGEYSPTFSDLDIEMPAGGTVLFDGNGNENIEYEGFFCYIRPEGSAYCIADNAGGVRVEKYFWGNMKESFICWALHANTVGNQVCQSISGRAVNDMQTVANYGYTF